MIMGVGLQVCCQSMRCSASLKMETEFPPKEAFRSSGVNVHRENRTVTATHGSYQDDGLLETSSLEAKKKKIIESWTPRLLSEKKPSAILNSAPGRNSC